MNNLFNNFQDFLNKKIENFNNREDKNVFKKILFWMILFFPYALYLLIFKTKIKKIYKIVITILFIVLTILFIDVSLYPNRVYDKVAKETYIEFINKNTDLELEEPLYASKSSHFQIGNQMYFTFNIYDKLNMYNGIFEVKDFNKNYKLVSLYDIDYNFSNIYSQGIFKDLTEIHPAIISFLFGNNNNLKIKDITNFSKIYEEDLFENVLYQDIMIKEELYSFELNDFTVFKVKNKDKEIYSLDLSNSFRLYSPQSVRKILNKNFKSNYSFVGYNYFNSKHMFNVKVGDKNYTVEYLPGVESRLLSITDLDEFTSHLESLIFK